jgi:hypothetical protein
MNKIVKRLRLPSCNTLLIAAMISTRNKAIKLMTNKEIVINNIWKKTLILLLMYRKFIHLLTTTRSNHLCIAKNNWTSILQKISSNEENNENTIPSLLFQLLLFEFSFCNGLCGSNSKFIYIIPIPIPVVKQVDKLITNDLKICNKDDMRFFSLDSDDDDESPLLRSTDKRLWKNTKSISQRIKAFFYR